MEEGQAEEGDTRRRQAEETDKAERRERREKRGDGWQAGAPRAMHQARAMPACCIMQGGWGDIGKGSA